MSAVGQNRKKRNEERSAQMRQADAQTQSNLQKSAQVSNQRLADAKAASAERDLRKTLMETPPELRSQEQNKVINPAMAVRQQATEEQADAPVQVARDIAKQADRFPNQTNIPVAKQAEIAAQTGFDSDTFRKIQEGTATMEERNKAIRNFNLNEMDLSIIMAGEADVSRLSQVADSLGGFLPGSARRYVPLLSTPTKKTFEIKDNLKSTQSNIDLWTAQAAVNPAAAGRYVQLIANAENEVLRMESRIKLLTIQSPALQANPEEIDNIMIEITNTKTKVQAGREQLQLMGIR
jgi:hypothetical protein